MVKPGPVSLFTLQARFVRRTDGGYKTVKNLADADGIMFLCPKCYRANGSSIGTHSILCWRPRVGPEHRPGPGRWELTGLTLGDVTLKGAGGAGDSVHLQNHCGWHGFIRDGEAVDA